MLDAPALRCLLDAGFVIVGAGGGGIPVVAGPDGVVHGISAVIDKDLAAALLARSLDADALVIATDVDHAMIDFGKASARAIGPTTPAELRGFAADGQFASGSMGPEDRSRGPVRGARRRTVCDHVAAPDWRSRSGHGRNRGHRRLSASAG